jgi:GcrA cell cycle regulator
MEWNAESIARLKSLWAEGLSTAEIGRRLSVSKNAVVGKAHRLQLDSRPSPIRRDPSGVRATRVAAPRRLTGPTLPSLAEIDPIPEPTPEPLRTPPPSLNVAPKAERSDRRRVFSCCWPIGEPGTRSFRFCDAESMTGKPYCETHAALAYVKIRDRREDAA